MVTRPPANKTKRRRGRPRGTGKRLAYRPRVPTELRRTAHLSLRVMESDLKLIADAVRRAGINRSEWLYRLVRQALGPQ